MNQILQLKGQFQQKKNDNKPGPGISHKTHMCQLRT